MQSQAPGSGFGSDMILPMLLMDSDSTNEDLMFFMMMTQNKKCLPIEPRPLPVITEPIVVIQPQPKPEPETEVRAKKKGLVRPKLRTSIKDQNDSF